MKWTCLPLALASLAALAACENRERFPDSHGSYCADGISNIGLPVSYRLDLGQDGYRYSVAYRDGAAPDRQITGMYGPMAGRPDLLVLMGICVDTLTSCARGYEAAVEVDKDAARVEAVRLIDLGSKPITLRRCPN